ncbi:hypothetical protein ILYODFUR_030762, partial [Ilyodon furcidens]
PVYTIRRILDVRWRGRGHQFLVCGRATDLRKEHGFPDLLFWTPVSLRTSTRLIRRSVLVRLEVTLEGEEALASFDLRASHGLSHDPMPVRDEENSHGTHCAGEVAMEANNSYCGVGIAFNARIG